MYLGRIAGCVWAAAKDPHLVGQRLLIVQPITPDFKDRGKQVVCTDCTGAGAGEIVYWTRGKEASFPFLPTEVPTDMTVVGIVDSLNLKKEPAAGPQAAPVVRAGETKRRERKC
jgi:ethanolamine utilization protein EutN